MKGLSCSQGHANVHWPNWHVFLSNTGCLGDYSILNPWIISETMRVACSAVLGTLVLRGCCLIGPGARIAPRPRASRSRPPTQSRAARRARDRNTKQELYDYVVFTMFLWVTSNKQNCHRSSRVTLHWDPAWWTWSELKLEAVQRIIWYPVGSNRRLRIWTPCSLRLKSKKCVVFQTMKKRRLKTDKLFQYFSPELRIY